MNDRCIRELGRGGRTREGRWLYLGRVILLPLSPFRPPPNPSSFHSLAVGTVSPGPGFQQSPPPPAPCQPKGLAHGCSRLGWALWLGFFCQLVGSGVGGALWISPPPPPPCNEDWTAEPWFGGLCVHWGPPAFAAIFWSVE